MAATEHAQSMKNDSRDFLATAALQLLQNERRQDLTVTKICKRAGLSRMAFYRNFDDIDGLLSSIYQPKITAIFDKIKAHDKQIFEEQLAFFDDFTEDFLLAEKQGFEPIIQSIFMDNMAQLYANQEPYLTTFLSAGVYAVWRRWILGGKAEPLSQIHTLLSKLGQL